MKFGVCIMPREVILDTQGRTVENILKHSYKDLQHVSVGKWIEVTVDQTDEMKAYAEVQKMTEYLLYNSLIETYKIQRIS